MTVTKTLLDFFESKGGLPGASEAEQLACQYLDAGVIDSMGLIEMIAHLEEQCGVRFTAEHLQSLEFQSIGGVVAIVERLRGAAD